MPKLPQVRDAASVEANTGAVVEAIGRYAVIGTGRHEVMRTLPDGSTVASTSVVRLGVGGGVWINLWVRSDAEMKRLEDKTVVVTGKLVAPAPRSGVAAQPDPAPSLVEIKSIREVADR